jgi:hypothetical protein
MAKRRQEPIEKNPLGASILSLIPGVGFFYIGNFLKGIAYMLIFGTLVALAAEGGGGPESAIFGLMIAGFYIYQIMDAYNEAKRTRYREVEDEIIVNGNGNGTMSLFLAVVIVVIGVLFQLVELDVMRLDQIARLWPLMLIGLGVRFIYNYSMTKREEESEYSEDSVQQDVPDERDERDERDDHNEHNQHNQQDHRDEQWTGIKIEKERTGGENE